MPNFVSLSIRTRAYTFPSCPTISEPRESKFFPSIMRPRSATGTFGPSAARSMRNRRESDMRIRYAVFASAVSAQHAGPSLSSAVPTGLPSTPVPESPACSSRGRSGRAGSPRHDDRAALVVDQRLRVGRQPQVRVRLAVLLRLQVENHPVVILARHDVDQPGLLVGGHVVDALALERHAEVLGLVGRGVVDHDVPAGVLDRVALAAS